MRKKEFEIARQFQEIIIAKTFGFSSASDSGADDIIRYDGGIKEIARLTGKTVQELESICQYQIDKESDIIDARFIFGHILFEYSSPLTEDEEVDKNTGWWKVYSFLSEQIGEIDELEEGDEYEE